MAKKAKNNNIDQLFFNFEEASIVDKEKNIVKNFHDLNQPTNTNISAQNDTNLYHETNSNVQTNDLSAQNLSDFIKDENNSNLNNLDILLNDDTNLLEPNKTNLNNHTEELNNNTNDIALKQETPTLSQNTLNNDEFNLSLTLKQDEKEELVQHPTELNDETKELLATKPELSNLKQMDVIAYLKDLKAKNVKVDLVLTDPPYNISKKNNFKTMGRAGIDFGSWDYDFDQTAWLETLKDVVKEDGSILIFNDWKNMSQINAKLSEYGFNHQELILWQKPNPMPRNVNRRYVTDAEYCLFASRTSNYTFHQEYLKYLAPWFECATDRKRIHPTQKPEGLIRDMLMVFSNEHDKVLDCFFGSGAILKTALSLNRSIYGCELDTTYFNEGIKNIANYNLIDLNSIKRYANKEQLDNLNNYLSANNNSIKCDDTLDDDETLSNDESSDEMDNEEFNDNEVDEVNDETEQKPWYEDKTLQDDIWDDDEDEISPSLKI